MSGHLTDAVDTSLFGRVVVVTGASQGIGRVVAMHVAASGARVVLTARNADKLHGVANEIVAAGASADVIPADCRDPGAVASLADWTANSVGATDALVICNGIAGPTKPLWQVEPAEWVETLEANLTSVYLLCRAFLPAMIERGSGSVVILGSTTGKRPLHGRTPYAASKMGLVGLVRTLAWETGPHGVRVNLISPGAVDGDRIRTVIDAQSRARGVPASQAEAELVQSAALGRFVDPEHVARAAVYLSSDAAGSITGEDMNISAGMTMY